MQQTRQPGIFKARRVFDRARDRKSIAFCWILGFGSKVRIKAPEDVKKQYKEQILKAAELIKQVEITNKKMGSGEIGFC